MRPGKRAGFENRWGGRRTSPPGENRVFHGSRSWIPVCYAERCCTCHFRPQEIPMTAGVLHPLRQWLAAAAILSLALGAPAQLAAQNPEGERRHLVEQLGAVAVVQFYADGFDRLTPKQRLLAYYLAEAGIAGDPIYYDEISPYGLEVKQLLEGIWTHPQGIEAGVAEKLRRYTKLIWVYHGNYDLDSGRKFLPEFTAAELRAAARQALKNGANFGVKDARALDGKLSRLEQAIFDP